MKKPSIARVKKHLFDFTEIEIRDKIRFSVWSHVWQIIREPLQHCPIFGEFPVRYEILNYNPRTGKS